MALTKTPIELSSTPSIVDGGNATAITIDSSENVGIGTTTTAPGAGNTVSGVEIRGGSDNRSFFSASANYAMHLNRNTSDGEILYFAKDGTAVGSIGTIAGYMTAGTSDTGVLFHSGEDSVQPWNVSTNAGRDNAINLGASNARFKDLYLSGGVNFSANANAGGMTSETLDDYEEGTWTPLITGDGGPTSGQSYGSVTGHYTKIGSFVFCACDVALTALGTIGGSYAIIGGLPFSVVENHMGGGSVGYYSNINNNSGVVNFYATQNQVYLMTGSLNYVSKNDLTNTTRVIATIVYKTGA